MNVAKWAARLGLVSFVPFMIACSSVAPINPGEIPAAPPVTQSQKAGAEQAIVKETVTNNHRELTSGPELARVKKVVNRLAITAGFAPNAIKVHVVDAGDTVNAKAFGGASIVVYTKLLERVRDDNELAVVLGHEMGHILAKHYENAGTMKSRSKAVAITSTVFGVAASVATAYAGLGGDFARRTGNLTQEATGALGYGAFVGSFSREQERQADQIGLVLMAKAGYDPAVAPKFWARSKEVFGFRNSEVGAFFSTHPAEVDREDALKEQLVLAESIYAKVPRAGSSAPSEIAAKQERLVQKIASAAQAQSAGVAAGGGDGEFSPSDETLLSQIKAGYMRRGLSSADASIVTANLKRAWLQTPPALRHKVMQQTLAQLS